MKTFNFKSPTNTKEAAKLIGIVWITCTDHTSDYDNYGDENWCCQIAAAAGRAVEQGRELELRGGPVVVGRLAVEVHEHPQVRPRHGRVAARAHDHAAVERIVHLGLEDVGFQPYSIRRGGATAYFRATRNMEAALDRGRWSSARVARIYLNDRHAREVELRSSDTVTARLRLMGDALQHWLKE